MQSSKQLLHLIFGLAHDQGWKGTDKAGQLSLTMQLAASLGTIALTPLQIQSGLPGITPQAARAMALLHTEALRDSPGLFAWLQGRLSIREARSKARTRKPEEIKCESFVKQMKPLPAPKRRKSLSLLKPEWQAEFDLIWSNHPKRSDGKPSRGSLPKAEAAFAKLITAGYATAEELRMAHELYRNHPNVQEGFVQMVATFFSEKDGLWREAVRIVRSTNPSLLEA